MSAETDIPALHFVDPSETDRLFRIVLWAAPGEGKSVGAASAPDPIVVLSADRPGAYRFARRHYAGKDIREVRYENARTLDAVLGYLRQSPEVRTVILDPFGGVYDRLVDQAPRRSDGEPDYQKVNKRILDWLIALRDVDVNVVIVAHEKLNDGKKGDGKLYPACGGPALINKVTGEADIVARVYRARGEDGQTRFMAQLQPSGNVVCKDSTPPPGLGESPPATCPSGSRRQRTTPTFRSVTNRRSPTKTHNAKRTPSPSSSSSSTPRRSHENPGSPGTGPPRRARERNRARPGPQD